MSVWNKATLNGSGHLPRWSNSATIVKDKDVYFFGGCNRQGDHLVYFNDVWVLTSESWNSFSWKQLNPSGSAPTPRCAHSSAFISSSKGGDRLIVFGGRNEDVSLNDIHYFNMATNFWVTVNPLTPIRARCGHTGAVYQKKLVVFGGFAFPTDLLNDVCILDTDTNSWTVIDQTKKPTQPPSPRFLHSATVVGKKMFVFGGFDGRLWLSDLHIFDLVSSSWTAIGNVTGADIPGPRCGHSADVIGTKIYIFGGEGPEGHTNKLASLETDKLVWTPVDVDENSAPSPRQGHSGFVLNSKYLCVVGGMENYDEHIYIIELTKVQQRSLEKTKSLSKMDRGGMAAILTASTASSSVPSVPVSGDGGEGDSGTQRYKDLYLKEKNDRMRLEKERDKLQEKCNMLQEETDWLTGKLQQMIQEREVLIAQGKLATGPGRTDPASLINMVNEIRSRSRLGSSEKSDAPPSPLPTERSTDSKSRVKASTSNSATYAALLSDVNPIPSTDTIRSVGKTLTSFLMKRPTKDVLVNKGILAKESIAEVPLNLQTVQLLVHEIEAKGGLESEGLFRLSGETNKVIALYNFIASNERNDAAKLKEALNVDVNNICGVLKKYFRECLPPLFPVNTTDTFISCLDPLNLSGMRDSVALLPSLNKSILTLVMTFLKSISDKSDVNKMTPPNLGIVFGPTLFRTTAPTTMEQIKQSNLLCGVIQKMIENFSTIFSRERRATQGQAPVQVMFK